MEIKWYGIDCNIEDYISDIEKAFVYLEIINTECELPHQFECEIKTFITKKSSFCVFTSNVCTTSYTIELLNVLLIAENDDMLITENSNNLIV
jgi:ribosomal protein RSM22 (predicted rRNA methylase)